ncbi:MAG: hypothetical protein HUJ86_03520 [Synergistes sp.]|nr:hypothetical protein [Synergistes sp.]
MAYRTSDSDYDDYYDRPDDDSEIDLIFILDSLWKRKYLIALITAVFIIAAVVVVFLIPRKYESSATLLFQPPVPQELTAKQETAPQGDTPTGLFTSDTYISLAKAPDLLADVISIVYSGDRVEERPTINDIRENLDAKLIEKNDKQRSQVQNPVDAMTVSFSDEDPQIALTFLNVWAKLYIKRNSQHLVDRAGSSYEFIGETVANVKKDLEETEKQLVDYQHGKSLALLKTQLETTQKIYSELFSKYNQDLAELSLLEAKAKAADALLALEKETKSLSRGMTKDAIWNFLSKELTENELKNLRSLNITDELENAHYNHLKTVSANTKIEVSALKAQINDLGKKIEKIKQEHVQANDKLIEMKTEVDRLELEKKTLQESYVDLSKKYQLSRIATVEATEPIKIIEKPILATKPMPRGGAKIVAVAALLGLFIGCMAALLAEMFAKRRASEARV